MTCPRNEQTTKEFSFPTPQRPDCQHQSMSVSGHTLVWCAWPNTVSGNTPNIFSNLFWTTPATKQTNNVVHRSCLVPKTWKIQPKNSLNKLEKGLKWVCPNKLAKKRGIFWFLTEQCFCQRLSEAFPRPFRVVFANDESFACCSCAKQIRLIAPLRSFFLF